MKIKGRQSSNKNRKVRWRQGSRSKKCVETPQKQTMDVILNL